MSGYRLRRAPAPPCLLLLVERKRKAGLHVSRIRFTYFITTRSAGLFTLLPAQPLASHAAACLECSFPSLPHSTLSSR